MTVVQDTRPERPLIAPGRSAKTADPQSHRAPMNLFVKIQTWLYGGMTEQLSVATGSWDPFALGVAVATAVFFGFVHAFMPGHGKTVLVSYFLGHGGHPWRGFAMAATLAVTHVLSAILLVLAGFSLLQRTLGGAGRAPDVEFASGVLVAMIGVWLLWRALRKRRAAREGGSARTSGTLAIAAGLVPCPLTTFVMVYAVSRGVVLAGLAVSLAMAIGLIATLALFALGAIFARERTLHIFNRFGDWPRRIGRALEVCGALGVTAFGVFVALNS